MAGREIERLGKKDKASKQEMGGKRERERGRRQELANKEREIEVELEGERKKQIPSKAIRINKVQEIERE